MEHIKKTVRKSVQINTAKEKVWEVLMNDKYTRSWYDCFSEGTVANTDWQEGSKAVFSDHSGSGIIGRIAVNKPTDTLAIEYDGILSNGKEDYTSDDAKSLKGYKEIYTLTGSGNATRLDISCDISEDHFDLMSASWDKAVEKIKELAEKE